MILCKDEIPLLPRSASTTNIDRLGYVALSKPRTTLLKCYGQSSILSIKMIKLLDVLRILVLKLSLL